jgi:hypothetical protein
MSEAILFNRFFELAHPGGISGKEGDRHQSGVEVDLDRVHAFDSLHRHMNGMGAGSTVHAEDGHVDVSVFGVCGGRAEERDSCESKDFFHGEILSVGA